MIIGLIFSVVSDVVVAQKLYTTKQGEISFYSKAPIQDIDAHNKDVAVVLNTETGEVGFVAQIGKFEFRNKKMQQDFNENYLDTREHPKATFEGKIQEKIDLSKDGSHSVMVKGKLTIHGVTQDRVEKGTVTVRNKTISIESHFKLAVRDFDVKIPRLLVKNIAEVVDVTVKAELTPSEVSAQSLR